MAGLTKVRRYEFPGKISAQAGSRAGSTSLAVRKKKKEKREREGRGRRDTLVLHIVLITEGRFVRQCLSG